VNFGRLDNIQAVKAWLDRGLIARENLDQILDTANRNRDYMLVASLLELMHKRFVARKDELEL
jgi:hypothetical protein